jgi:ribonuclease G
VEATEALHVIDVNSGYKSASHNQEDNSLQTNLEAAEEIARQLRLRDLGGIIVVDFIDMKLPENKKKLHDAMDGFMKADRARHSILPISKFGLMQITRQRMKPEIDIKTDEACPTCQGTGKIASTLVLEDDIRKNLDYLLNHGHKHLTLMVHPMMAAYLKRGFPSLRLQWSFKHRQNIRIRENNNLPLVHYRFFDNDGEEIKL